MKKFTFALFLLVFFSLPTFAQRLPNLATPHHYILQFEPDFTTDKFHGEETIHGDALVATDKIVLNAIDIEFLKTTVQALPADANGKPGEVLTATVTSDPKSEMATLQLPSQIPAGPIEIKISYNGILNDQLRGFYLSKANGRKYAVTQMEPTDARRAFPGFDEPDYKAPYDISVIAPKADMAISNGSIVSDTPGPGADKHTIKFSMTPKMSSYLVALMVGEFKCISSEQDGIPIRVCAVPEKADLLEIAMQDTKENLHYYDNYYGIKYPFKKLDVIAFPDFSAGAMENTAAITYRETLLLADPKTVSSNLRRAIAEVLAHEMAHQWFGDLVTMKWWNDIWLNEGFATWMETKPLKALHPEWSVPVEEAQATANAMGTDSLKNTRSIRTNAETSSEIAELFDGIAYGKTGSVLRMVEAYLGEDVYRAGVNQYLDEHKYGNAAAEDFWGTMARSSKRPVDQIIKSFVTQPGVPMVSVSAKCDGGATKVAVTQKRFYYNRDVLKAPNDQSWTFPLCYTMANGKQGCELIEHPTQEFAIAGCSKGTDFNSGGRGFYRVAYDPATYTELTARAEKLLPEDRISLLDNQWALMRADRGTIGDFLTLLDGLKNVRERAVMERMADRLTTIHDDLVTPAERAKFEGWVRELLNPSMALVGYTEKKNESADMPSVRANLVRALGYAGNDPAVIAKADELARMALKDFSSVQPELREVAIPLAAKQGDAALYDQYLQRAKSATAPEEIYTWLYALTAFEKPELVQRTLEYSLSSGIRNQDFGGFLNSVMETMANQKQGWEFVKANWARIQPKLATYSPGEVYAVGAGFCDAGLRDDYAGFFQQHPIPGAQRSYNKVMEVVNNCIDLRNQEQPKMSEWLGKQSMAKK